MKEENIFPGDRKRDREFFWYMTFHDFRKSHLGSVLGALWVFLNPLILTLIFLLIFGLGFRSRAPVGEVPFVVWFLAGLFAWNFFSETVMGSATIFSQYSYLLAKPGFRLISIPLFKLASNLLLHLINLLILFIVMLFYEFPLTAYWLQIIYYLLSMLLVTASVSIFVAVLNVFYTDIQNIVRIFIRLGFFFTPIFWQIDRINPNYQFIFKLNPMYYILEGYRGSLIFQEPLWSDMQAGINFWIASVLLLLLSIYTFQKLKYQIADMI